MRSVDVLFIHLSGGEGFDEVVHIGCTVGEKRLLVVEHDVGLFETPQSCQCHAIVGIKAGVDGVLVQVLIDGIGVCLGDLQQPRLGGFELVLGEGCGIDHQLPLVIACRQQAAWQ